jgi:hypothetical protein
MMMLTIVVILLMVPCLGWEAVMLLRTPRPAVGFRATPADVHWLDSVPRFFSMGRRRISCPHTGVPAMESEPNASPQSQIVEPWSPFERTIPPRL